MGIEERKISLFLINGDHFFIHCFLFPEPGIWKVQTILVKGMNSHIYMDVNEKTKYLEIKCLVNLTQLPGMAASSLCWNKRELHMALPATASGVHTPGSLLSPQPSSFSPPQCTGFLNFPVDAHMESTHCFPEGPALHHNCI